ncbi:MAG TPA: feruloyl-CoA synthase [Candidatus Limnocylindrales bacterium]|nr:feruloyl-CoA synthase [Candidatus Limnocylindrales bacterium]
MNPTPAKKRKKASGKSRKRESSAPSRAPQSSNRIRSVRLRTSGATIEHMPGGSILVRPQESLRPYPGVLTDRVAHWAKLSPDRVCIAKRDAAGLWVQLTYAEVLDSIRKIGQSLLSRELSADRPVAILSENDLEQFLLTLACLHVGVPVAPISPSYSLLSKDFNRLRHAFQILTPGLVFVSDGSRYQAALDAVVPRDTEVVAASSLPAGRKATPFRELAQINRTPAVDAAHAKINPDSVAKILFTSGSTGVPRGVINTHRMMCSNLQMIAQIFGFLEDEPPVLVDWLPWHHTFGGNHNIGISLYNGGTFYLDEGKPAPGLIEETVRNLREISTTVFFNVPKGYEGLLPYLQSDRKFRETFFRRLRLLFYAAAGMSQPVWDAYRKMALETCGERIVMVTGLGATETSPMAIQTTWETDQPGVIGIPVPGVEMKLVPRGHKLECRVRGPNVTPGYWRQPEYTQKVFDADGFYSFGDAVRFVDSADVNKGFLFDGRFSEDFKLASGTWVSVGPLRSKILAHFTPFVRDVVITGHDRDGIGMLIFPDLSACSSLCPGVSPDSAGEILAHKSVRAKIQSLLESFARQSTGNSNRIVRALLAEEPPSLDAGEVTDKGSLNQRAVLDRRAALVEALYAVPLSAEILRLKEVQPARK